MKLSRAHASVLLWGRWALQFASCAEGLEEWVWHDWTRESEMSAQSTRGFEGDDGVPGATC